MLFCYYELTLQRLKLLLNDFESFEKRERPTTCGVSQAHPDQSVFVDVRTYICQSIRHAREVEKEK